MRIGYARVSTVDPELQLEKLCEAGCECVVVEKASGGKKIGAESLARRPRSLAYDQLD